MQWYLFVLNNKGLLKLLLDLGSTKEDKNKSANEIKRGSDVIYASVLYSGLWATTNENAHTESTGYCIKLIRTLATWDYSLLTE